MAQPVAMETAAGGRREESAEMRERERKNGSREGERERQAQGSMGKRM